MPSNNEYLDFILEQLSELDEISYRPMMVDSSSTIATRSSVVSTMIVC